MLAWSALVEQLAAGPERTLVVCDDPWLFRHLAAQKGVEAGRAPPLFPAELKLRLRGILAQTRAGLRFAHAAWRLRHQRTWLPQDRPALLVYGHPASTAEGGDAYFGTLMDHASLIRLLHIDAGLERVAALARPGRTASLHAFGSPLAAVAVMGARWRPRAAGPLAWLIRRAAMREGGTAQSAAIAWQIHCQRRWLDQARPQVVAWPWENHGWERQFVRDCRQRQVRTLGYQHATIGQGEWNYHAGSNPDGRDSLPDRIACSAVAYVRQLADWGIPAERLVNAGSWRIPDIPKRVSDPQGAVFVALPANAPLARQIVDACRAQVPAGWRFLVREHPMTPVGFEPQAGLERAPGSLFTCDGIRAVVFAATTVGLEAALAGLPAIRFLPVSIVANDICPAGLTVPTATAEDLGRVLETAHPVENAHDFTFTGADPALWCRLLNMEKVDD